jgi:hypothetical protein
MVNMVRSLREKVGSSELAVMILLGFIKWDPLMYQQIGIKSDAEFYRREADIMGISRSSAREYAARGIALVKYGHDIFNWVGETEGISQDELIRLHLSKLILYQQGIEKFGREGVLIRLKTLSFRAFKKEIVGPQPARQSRQKWSAEKAPDFSLVHKDQKEMILGLELAPSEKRALQIIVKGSKYYTTTGLTEDQFTEVERRLHQKRLDVLDENLKSAPIKYERKAFNPADPLALSDDLYNPGNINDVVLRIRAGLALVVPARRTIAILVNRLYYEKLYQNKWKAFYEGVEYATFESFCLTVLGLGMDYRDYIKIGAVLRDYYYYLDYLDDMDTESMFFKLKYLPRALTTHKGDEPLVLARLRSLTVREYKIFAEEPDYEITYSRRLTKQQLTQFSNLLSRIRTPGAPSHQYDFIEIFDKSEIGWVSVIEKDVLAESREGNGTSELPTLTQEEASEDKPMSEAKDDSHSVA